MNAEDEEEMVAKKSCEEEFDADTSFFKFDAIIIHTQKTSSFLCFSFSFLSSSFQTFCLEEKSEVVGMMMTPPKTHNKENDPASFVAIVGTSAHHHSIITLDGSA